MAICPYLSKNMKKTSEDTKIGRPDQIKPYGCTRQKPKYAQSAAQHGRDLASTPATVTGNARIGRELGMELATTVALDLLAFATLNVKRPQSLHFLPRRFQLSTPSSNRNTQSPPASPPLSSPTENAAASSCGSPRQSPVASHHESTPKPRRGELV
ncbi:Uncharacterized protein Fot_37122 [Forsythia ovata]|uniref:Uncharacterized protein n=1 Tax=Forsythia ovata TaxID=205694 RepID=A0ABD1STY7_9LAMI